MKRKSKMKRLISIPIVNFRDMDDQIGVVMLDPTKVPEGTDWGLLPGVHDDPEHGELIVSFTTHWLPKKGAVGTKEGGEK